MVLFVNQCDSGMEKACPLEGALYRGSKWLNRHSFPVPLFQQADSDVYCD